MNEVDDGEVLGRKRLGGKVRKLQEELLHLAQDAVRQSPADQTQIRLLASDNALTRFANSEIHQNTFEREAIVQVLARSGQREGQVTSNRLTPAALKEAVEQATAAAKISAANPDLADLPEGRAAPRRLCSANRQRPALRERSAMQAAAEVGEDGEYKAAGTLTTGQVNVVIVNSRGIEVAYSTTSARYTVQ
jgi:predicted Zn-dependent protease